MIVGVYCGFITYNDISCLVGFFFCTSHLLVIRRLSTQSSRGRQKEKLKATPTSTSKRYHHHHLLGGTKSKKRRPYFVFFAVLELPILQSTLLRWRPQQPRKKLTSTVETYKYLQLSTHETSSSQEFSIFLFVTLHHSSLYLECFKKKHYLPYPNFLDVYPYSFFIYQILDAVFL